jgi:glutathione S-transferase
VITLYDYLPSGNCYKVRLLLGVLGVEYATIPIDFHPSRQHKSPEFLRINPLGQIPVLDDGELRLRDAQAILVYLAARYDKRRRWYPEEPEAMGRIGMWLAFADSITATRVGSAPARRAFSTTTTSTSAAPGRTGCSASSTSISGLPRTTGNRGSPPSNTRRSPTSPASRT